jgi:hypothetical protein
MKKYIPFLLMLVSVVYLAPILVSAQEDQTVELAPDTSITSYVVDARQARISALKQQYKISLQPDEKKLVSERCKTAQVKLRAQELNLKLVTTARKTSYANIINDLRTLQTRLAAGQGDNPNLDLLIVLYQQKVAA